MPPDHTSRLRAPVAPFRPDEITLVIEEEENTFGADVSIVSPRPLTTLRPRPTTVQGPTAISPAATNYPPSAFAETSREPGETFGEGEPVNLRRVILTTVLFVSVMVLLFTFLAGNTTGTSIASASALISLILLVLPNRS